MTTTRQDAWTHDEDLLLAEVVLRHIREGATQLAAFEEVGRKLSRTAAACGFRWNSHVRKQYKTGIEVAKKQRKELRTLNSQEKVDEQKEVHVKEPASEVEHTESTQPTQLSQPTQSNQPSSNSKNAIKDLISFLQQYEDAPSIKEVQEENQQLRNKIQELQNEVEKLQDEKQSLTNHLQVVEEDYRALIEIMDRARKMVILQEDERSRKVKFQMDKNGNLERVEK
ncbi:RsfA family transcriptional regulator [Metabacillus litoralis]|uniref:RsfA family transcriptional regulator n=1 Tax=Metabacillus TaxID=2675233 RepID=UPI001B986CBD|nr:RsfA family transcriptional regulator [Metabacillus litoralis]MCM3408971.1 RsfA family transcriptional regulator [Metabacillus litoralis]UHA59392.1 RsfA family transcriptional regulator [Metabacillus litoralis]